MNALPGDYDTDPERFLSSEKYPHDDVHPYVAERFAAAVFGAPGDRVEADRWDGPLVTLSSGADAVAWLRVHGLSADAATAAAATLDLPLTLTARGCVVYATKAPPRLAPRRLLADTKACSSAGPRGWRPPERV